MGGISDHRPIVLKMKPRLDSTLGLFKFNQVWLEEVDFVSMVKNTWKPLYPLGAHSLMHRFTDNLSMVKESIKNWLKIFNACK